MQNSHAAAGSGGPFSSCTACGRRCGADRTPATPKAGCGIGRWAKIAATLPGQVIFAGCSLACLFCPTPEANRMAQGQEVTAQQLADLLQSRQHRGAALLELVHPGHVAAQILEALALIPNVPMPLAWSSVAFESVESLRQLEGRIAVYRPDLKFGCDRTGRMVAGVQDYVATSRQAVTEMLRQVGPMQPDHPQRGVLVRHQILPDDLAATQDALGWLPPQTPVQVFGDYRPHHRADRHPRLRRAVGSDEIAQAIDVIRGLDLVVWP